MDNPETSATLVTPNTQNEDKQNKTKNGQPRDIGNISHTLISIGCSFFVLFCLSSFCVLGVSNAYNVSGFFILSFVLFVFVLCIGCD
jgi:hypothetical protein